LGASALPFFMGGGDDDDDDKGVDYDLLKNKYADEIMRIKAGVSAGSLNPNQWSYLPSNYTYTAAEGGRIGLSNGGDPLLVDEYKKYVFEMEEMGLTPMSFKEFAAQARAGMYAGGQSVPSDYTIEDAIMTTTQDKLGGITEAMKRADLYRKGSVGQMYAANGGRIGLKHGKIPFWKFWGGAQKKIEEKAYDTIKGKQSMGLKLTDEEKKYLDTHSESKAYGGRIGYDAGGQTGHPPITTGQVSQIPPQAPAPQAPPMPAPQPNPMAMMNRPMMGGRRMAQEGGLMDLGGMEKDYRQEGGFVPLGGEEKADDVPARLSKNEFVFTADAVRAAGGGDVDAGAEIMENVMENLEQGGQISEESQGLAGAREMFGVSERLSEVV